MIPATTVATTPDVCSDSAGDERSKRRNHQSAQFRSLRQVHAANQLRDDESYGESNGHASAGDEKELTAPR